jgi:hypothetical protein
MRGLVDTARQEHGCRTLDRGADDDRGGGLFGSWARDAAGLPCFDLAISEPRPPDLVLPDGDARRVWHQVGNDRVTATAHAGGWLTLYSAEAGLVRLSAADPARPEALGGTWRLETPEGRLLLASDAPEGRVRFGVGYAEWRHSAPGVEVLRRVFAPFGDLPALRVDVSVRASGSAQELAWVEQWGFAPLPIVLGGLMSPLTPPPSCYRGLDRLSWHGLFAVAAASRALTGALRRALASRLRLRPAGSSVTGLVALAPRNGCEPPLRPAPLARIPGLVFAAPLGAARTDACLRQHGACTTATLRQRLAAGEARFSFGVGIASREELAGIVAGLEAARFEETGRRWRETWSLEIGSAPELARESTWHAGMLRSATVGDRVLGSRYVPQGSAYSFVHGLQGAPRDYALSALPLLHLDPGLAREHVRLMLRLVDGDGCVFYAHVGAGFTTGAVAHPAPTDLPLALLWAVAELVFATGDASFLDEEIAFRPRRRGASAATTVRERVLLLWRHVRSGVGLGPNGLLRVGSGDWNDPLRAMAPSRRAFERAGESSYNSALACHVLPRAAALLRARHPEEAAAMIAFADCLRGALAATFTGRWFLRGYDGRERPDSAIGRDHLFLDANAWCLIAGIGTPEQRRRLGTEIETLCAAPSPIGPLSLSRPHRVRGAFLAPGEDVNGGVWAALSAATTWGLALHDPDAAWRSLARQSLAAHARAYPHVWYGIWSGPDSYNAHDAEAPGQTFVQPATPMREFPVMNSNAHAGPLLALLAVLGVESTPGGFTVTPRVPGDVGPWRLRTALLDVRGEGRAAWVLRRPPAFASDRGDGALGAQVEK